MEFYRISPTFMVASNLDDIAISESDVAEMTARPEWQEKLLNKANDAPAPESFSKLRRDRLEYPDKPTPEKRPINKLYFEHHGSIVCEYLEKPVSPVSNLDINKVVIRLFDIGALVATFSAKPKDSDQKYDVNQAISLLREARIFSRDLLFEAVRDFTQYWNSIFTNYHLKEVGGSRKFLLFDKYEYVDFGINMNSGTFSTHTLQEEGNIDQLRQLVGFCRMSKEYAWPNYSPKFIDKFLDNDISGRDDELWLIYRERFLRYYPDQDIEETTAYAKDLLLATELLLSLRTVYKGLLEKMRTQIADIPTGVSSAGYISRKERKKELKNLQEELNLAAFRISKCRFPSESQFYAASDFSSRVLRKLEDQLNLTELSSHLRTELDKIKGLLDSFSSIISHERNMSLQRSLYWLSVAVGFVAIAQLLTSWLIN